MSKYSFLKLKLILLSIPTWLPSTIEPLCIAASLSKNCASKVSAQKALREFKRTHQDQWEEHMEKVRSRICVHDVRVHVHSVQVHLQLYEYMNMMYGFMYKTYTFMYKCTSTCSYTCNVQVHVQMYEYIYMMYKFVYKRTNKCTCQYITINLQLDDEQRNMLTEVLVSPNYYA